MVSITNIGSSEFHNSILFAFDVPIVIAGQRPMTHEEAIGTAR